MVTGHGARSITGVEVNLDPNRITEKQLSAIPGIIQKMAWNLITTRIKRIRKLAKNSNMMISKSGLMMHLLAKSLTRFPTSQFNLAIIIYLD